MSKRITIYLFVAVNNVYGDPDSMLGAIKGFGTEAERDAYVEAKNAKEDEYTFWVSQDVTVDLPCDDPA